LDSDAPPARSIERVRVERYKGMDEGRTVLCRGRDTMTGRQEHARLDKRAGATPDQTHGNAGIVRITPDEQCADIGKHVEEVHDFEQMELGLLAVGTAPILRVGSLSSKAAQ